jgi:prenyltransferase beta subunit
MTAGADLWCTYAAVRTHAWLGRTVHIGHADRTARYVLGNRNADGGFAWTRGMPSDAWATFYCTATLADLGRRLPDVARTGSWLRATWAGDAYAMMPGQAPEVWATHFSVRTAVEVCGEDVPDRVRLLKWLRALQTVDGGLSWSPGHAAAGDADVRACYYGVAAWRALNAGPRLDPPWDVPALVAWLQKQQLPDGGFGFDAGSEVSCMWATYRAVGALVALGAKPLVPITEWIHRQRDTAGAFVRWPGYPVADVWASFCAVGALRATGALTGEVADATERRLAALACPDGGYTYREPEQAADALTVAARALTTGPADPARPELVRWLEGCQLPNEGGVMYMPGRGAEVRCTAWALAAGAFRTNPRATNPNSRAVHRIADWLRRLQNPDGGFGYWEGRGSDLVSTAAAVEICRLLGRPVHAVLDVAALAGFVDRGDGTATPVALRPGLQALRVLLAVGRGDRAAAAELLSRHRVPGGGWAGTGNRLPDLMSTYEAVVTADRFRLPVDHEHVTAFLDRTAAGTAAAWSPLAPRGGDPLADCLHALLRRRLREPSFPLPALTLS